MENCLGSSLEQEDTGFKLSLDSLDTTASRKLSKTERVMTKDSGATLKRLPLDHGSFNKDKNCNGFKSIKQL